MAKDDLYKRLLAEIEKIPLVDTHEHLISERARRRQKIDFFSWFAHYGSTDLVSAGMSPATLDMIRDPEMQLDERWNHVAPFWKHARSTGYGRVLLRAARDLFEVSDINETTWRELSEKIAASNRDGWYHYVLKEKGNFEICILHELKWRAEEFKEDIPRQPEPELFAPVAMFDDFIMISSRRPSVLPGGPLNPPGLDVISERTGVAIHSLDDLLHALDIAFEREVAEGVVGVKCALAYHRVLRFERPTKGEAEKVLNTILSNFEGHAGRAPIPALSWDELRPFQDYMMHQVIRRAIDHALPIQVHTGIQEGNANLITNSNPTHLTNLFLQYPEADFDVFHAGYPFTSETAVLGKTFPNVYIDLCWVWAMGSGLAQRILDEWTEIVPANKIFAFGGDYIFVEGAYAASRLAREGVAHTLAKKVREGYLRETEAISLATKILRENARTLFRLS